MKTAQNLIKFPKKPDLWALVILQTVEDFYKEYKFYPNRTQTWVRLAYKPPKKYKVQTNKGSSYGKNYLTMPDTAKLTKRAFYARFARYITTN